MKWRHWSILIVLVLLNYIIFSTAFTQLAEQRRPKFHTTRTPQPTFENLEPTAAAWIVLPTSTPRPSRTPITPTPTATITPTPEITFTIPLTATGEIPTTEIPATATATPEEETVTHVVAEGETLSEIAAQYAVSAEAIMACNSLADPDLVVAGQELTIPVPSPPPATSPAAPTYTPKPSNTPKPSSTPKPPATKAPTAAPTTAPALQFTGQLIWDGSVAPNCGGPGISKLSVIRDANGNPINGVRVEADCYGNKWLSHPSGTPGEYEAGHYDFAFGQLSPQDWTCTARVFDLNGQPVTSSEVITIHFDTNDCKPGGNGHQVAIVHWTKRW
jgi:LysM repeat protein